MHLYPYNFSGTYLPTPTPTHPYTHTEVSIYMMKRNRKQCQTCQTYNTVSLISHHCKRTLTATQNDIIIKYFSHFSSNHILKSYFTILYFYAYMLLTIYEKRNTFFSSAAAIVVPFYQYLVRQTNLCGD